MFMSLMCVALCVYVFVDGSLCLPVQNAHLCVCFVFCLVQLGLWLTSDLGGSESSLKNLGDNTNLFYSFSVFVLVLFLILALALRHRQTHESCQPTKT